MNQSKTLSKHVFFNTLSNYWSLGANMVMMALLMRIQYTNIPYQDYGFWSLIWSIFGYSLLLDFGFGVSVQKYTSQVSVTGDWKKYNSLVSTIFFTYCLLGLVLIAIVVALSGSLDTLFRFQAGSDIEYYRSVFLVFGIGTAILFPFGFFSEMLTGMQLIRIRNRIQLLFVFLNFLAMAFVILSGYGLIAMVYVSIGTHIGKNGILALVASKKIPKLSIRISHAKVSLLKEVASFSMFAYLITFSNLIVFNTDQIVISAFASVELVALYQAAAKIAQIFKDFSTQFNENLGPLATIFHTSEQHDELAKMQLLSTRIIGFIATLMVVPLFAYIKPLLVLWLELTAFDTWVCAVILLCSMYFYVLFRSGSIKILLMTGKERSLAVAALAECIGNLVISIILVRRIGIIGVAIGTLVPNILIGLIYNLPVTIRETNLTLKSFFTGSIIRTLLSGVLAYFLSIGLLSLYTPENLWVLLLYCMASCGIYVIVYAVIGLTREERVSLLQIVNSAVSSRRRSSH